MIGLRFQLVVVFYTLISGRYAYKEYLSDDANEYNHETGTNFSQINYNEPPGKCNYNFVRPIQNSMYEYHIPIDFQAKSMNQNP